MRKGSMTVFLSLTLLLILSLLSASLFSVRLAADRAVCASAADQALFSLFSEYDRDLFGRYHLLFLDGGLDTGKPAFGAYVRFLKESAEHVFHPGKGRILSSGNTPCHLELRDLSLTGYTTAAESSGKILAQQAVTYMKNTLGIQGVQLLLDTFGSPGNPAGESTGEAIANKDLNAGMSEIRAKAPPPDPETSPAVSAGAENFENPVETIAELKKLSLLKLVLPPGKEISGKSLDVSALPSGRSLEPSLGIVSVPPDFGTMDRILFLEYIFRHCGSFISPREGALAYAVEYILCGRPSDAENLQSVLRSLLVLRTGANAASILSDAALKSQAAGTAMTIAAALAIPEFQPAVEALLIAGWAWCESIVDLRALLGGKKVAPAKTAADWQLSISSIPDLLSRSGELEKDNPRGLSYEGYLRMLFLAKKQDTLQLRLLDVIESTVRAVCGRPSFRIDLCIDTAEASFGVMAENILNLETIRSFSYREV